MPLTFLKGIIIGFSIAAPVGPIGLLCIRRTLQYGRLHGLLTGLGAATADGLYGCIAAGGFVLVTNLLTRYVVPLRIIGGIYICYFGLRIIRERNKARRELEISTKNLFSSYISTFVLTITNPMTIVSFVGVLAAQGLKAGGPRAESIPLVGGIILGSALWWLCLSTGVSFFRSRMSDKILHWINLIAGILLICMGIKTLILQ